MTATQLDQPYPEQERIPQLMRAEITTTPDGRAVTTINGKKFGSPLSDNRWVEDGYRFHDVFHLSHAAVLGWSPTLRGLLGRKRRSNPSVDDIEDGGRAIVIEEGLIALIFSYAEHFNFFQDQTYLDSPGEQTLLSAVQLMTNHLEVSVRTDRDWKEAILQGYQAWRTIHAQSGGTLTADLASRTLTVHAEPEHIEEEPP